jgi:GNAT superfamily N-acetyltransferase
MRIRRLRASDSIEGFSSGDAGLDRYLSTYAIQNQEVLGIGVTYVVPTDSGISGFVTLVAASIRRDDFPAPNPEAYPLYPLPALRLARLAVDCRVQGAGLGGALVLFAQQVAEVMRASVGCAALIVDALPAAVTYYERLGFRATSVVEGGSAARPRPVPMSLMLNDLHEDRPSE